MLTSLIVRVVAFCVRHAWGVILAAVVLSPASGVCAVRHFAIDTKIDNLMSPSLDWRKREITYHNEFPQSIQLILVVVDGPTPELAGAATRALAEELSKKTDLFRSVPEAAGAGRGGGPCVRRNGLLYLPTEQLGGTATQPAGSGPPGGGRASDPSPRGL